MKEVNPFRAQTRSIEGSIEKANCLRMGEVSIFRSSMKWKMEILSV